MPWSATRVAFDDVVRVQEALDCPEPMAWVLVRRGLRDPDVAREFLTSDGPLDPPEAIPGIAEAADRLAHAVRTGERIVVHGDYDCDGICSTAILLRALEARGARVRAFLPSRFTDGYGVNVATVERLADEGCDLLVTVDCGTTAVDALQRAVELGIDSVVCDHHLAGGVRPPAIIANPALGHPSEALPAAAGVTFKLTQALATRLDGDGRLGPDPDEALDLVALATVADAVPLIGENRRLVARGIAAIRSSPRPGIAALCTAAGISARAIDARGLGWNLAPAINAAGRMAHPEQALAILLGEDSPALAVQASQLWNLNLERREVEQRVTAEAIAILDASPDEVTRAHALVVAGDGWHEGVVGIVASRLVERFSRPAIVVTIGDDGGAKGSGRSLPGVDLHALVSGAAGPLDRWGGHAGAIGVQLQSERIAEFRSEVAAAAEPYQAAIRRAGIRAIDAVVGLRDLTLSSAEALEALQPFGTGNPEVRLVIPACTVESVGRMGDGRRHLQMRVGAGGAHARVLGWGMGERAERIAVGERHDVVVQLTVDRWQELVGPRLTLEGIDALTDSAPIDGQCATLCDVTCAQRVTVAELLERATEMPTAPTPEGAPAGVRDRRTEGAVISTLTMLAGADRGVIAVVSDLARRRVLLDGVLSARRLGVEVAVLGGARCAALPREERLLGAMRRPALVMVDYRSLDEIALPEGLHLALVDPPEDARQAEWAAFHATHRWLHLLWGADEMTVAIAAAERRWELREAAAALWRAIANGDDERRWGPDLDTAVFGDGSALRDPGALACALRALVELGRIVVSDTGLRGAQPPDERRLEQTRIAADCAQRLEEARAFIERSLTLSFEHTAISSSHA